MTSRMVGSVLTLLSLLFSAGDAAAQTYTQMQWGMNKGVTPYQFGANINNTWRNLGTVSSAGAWSLSIDNLVVNNSTTFKSPVQINLTSGTRTDRGPLFIWNNPTGSTPAGYNAGIQVWVGDNPTATPGANDTVGSTIAVTNGNNRGYLYGENLVVGQCGAAEGCPASYLDANMYGLEINTYSSASFSVSQDAFKGLVGGTYLKNMLVLTSSGPQHMSSGIGIVSAATNGSAWPYEGIEVSRVVNNGLHFVKNPNLGIVDGAPAFTNAAIYDESDSSRVLKVKGAHDSVISVEENPTLTMFVRAPYAYDAVLPFRNGSNQNLVVSVDSGGNTSQFSTFSLSDRGVQKWNITKDLSNDLQFFNTSRSNSDVSIVGATGSVQFKGASPQITVGTDATLAGGVAIANGSASGQSVTMRNPSATAAYNFNLPATAGTSSYLLTSAGGGSSAMTWTIPSTTVNGTTCALGNTCTVPASSIALPVTVSGTVTSGGIPYFNSSTQMSSSAVLTANALMIGGGAGAAPTTTTTGTGVVTAIGNNTNSSGGLVTFGGNIGAASGTSLALTGGASTGSDLLVGGGSNSIGLGRATVINAPAASTTGFLFSVGGTATAYFSSGTTYAQLLTASNSVPLLLGTNNTARWKIDASTGHLLANVDATYNIGAAGATRPLNIYASGLMYASSYQSTGTKPTATGAGGTCAAGTVTGGATVGTVALTAACASTNTLALTSMPTATTGYVCDAADRTSGVINLVQTATSTTSATFTFNATTGATDVIQFKCLAY